MPTFVRIRDNSNKTEISVSVERAARLVERSDKIEILEGVRAVDGLGRPLAPSPAKGQSAKSSKEQTR